MGDSAHSWCVSLLAATLLGLVKLVVIDLETVDDAQVIFEALNARNTPLSATDLVKNLLFLRAQAEHHDTTELYEHLWKRFDDERDWWLEGVGTGHAQRARQDWLLGDWLIAQVGRSVNVGRLYGDFRSWLDTTGTKAFDALSTLNQYADAFELLNGRVDGAPPVERLAYQRIEQLNITAATPVLLWLAVQPPDVVDPDERALAMRALESYVVRRMAAKFQTRAYTAVFVDVLKAAKEATAHPGRAVIEALRKGPHSYAWPTTDDLVVAFSDLRYYGPGGINQGRLRLLLGAVDARLQALDLKSETPLFDYEDLQVEHVIPQSWATWWPVLESDPALKALAEQTRERYVNRIGNLTLVTGPLNAGMSNDPWTAKKEALQEYSNLKLNARLLCEEVWDEEHIVERGQWIARELEHTWPGPDSPTWDG